MRALLDEQLSPEIARILRERGLDVAAVSERAGLIEATDREVMEAASGEQRAIVTNDIKDFRPLAANRLADGTGHAGVIFIPANRPRTRADAGRLADAIETVMRAHPGGMADSEHWIAPSSE